MTRHPQLSVGDVNQLPPVLLTLDLGCLEVNQEQVLFTETEEVFDIETAGIRLIDVLQGELMTTFAHHDQPQGMFERLIALFIVAHNAHQCEGVFVHRQSFGFVLPRHQQGMPGLYLYPVHFAPTTRLPEVSFGSVQVAGSGSDKRSPYCLGRPGPGFAFSSSVGL